MSKVFNFRRKINLCKEQKIIIIEFNPANKKVEKNKQFSIIFFFIYIYS